MLEENPNSNLKVKKKIVRRYSELNKDSSKIECIGKEKYDKPETFLKMVYTNATSLNNKILELELYLRYSGWPHVVGIAETWFSETSIPTISGYTLYRRDIDSIHGGVCIYVKNDVKRF